MFLSSTSAGPMSASDRTNDGFGSPSADELDKLSPSHKHLNRIDGRQRYVQRIVVVVRRQDASLHVAVRQFGNPIIHHKLIGDQPQEPPVLFLNLLRRILFDLCRHNLGDNRL